MWKAAVLLTVLVTAGGVLALPCNSRLRLLLPDLFKHCNSCHYSSWTPWKGVERVISDNCTSKMALRETRYRYDFNKNCKNKTKERYLCEPTLEEKAKIFVKLLNLDSSGQGQSSPPIQGRNPRNTDPVSMDDSNSCQNRGYKHQKCTIQKRRRKDNSASLEEIRKEDNFTVLDKSVAPKPFNLKRQLNAIHKHHRERRDANQCGENYTYLLFMLDTSGSIGKDVFKKVKNTLASLITLFCDNIRVAVQTFSDDIYTEFCFNCFSNNVDAGAAIRSIQYRGGLTHTGTAIKCACHNILTIPCGIPKREDYRNCHAPIEVIILTDGRSNGPLNVCDEVQCIHNQNIYDIDAYAIGVKNYNEMETKCITSKDHFTVKSAFNMDSFTQLKQFLANVITCVNNTMNICYSNITYPSKTQPVPVPTTIL